MKPLEILPTEHKALVKSLYKSDKRYSDEKREMHKANLLPKINEYAFAIQVLTNNPYKI